MATITEQETQRYIQGFQDGMSCCVLHGKSAALQILKSNDSDLYIRGKQTACIDWLYIKLRPRIACTRLPKGIPISPSS